MSQSTSSEQEAACSMHKTAYILISYALVICSVCSFAELPSDDFETLAYMWTRTFAEVLQLAQQRHYKISNLQESMIRAMDAFLHTLDPHSSFLDPKMYKLILEAARGEFFGVGIVIDNTRNSDSEFLLVVDTIAAGPADKAGVKPLDRIVEIDSIPIKGFATEEIVAKLKGLQGSSVGVKIFREGQPDLISLTLIRDVVKEQAVLSFHIEPHDIYYVALTSFSQHAPTYIRALLQKAQQRTYKGLILDLRNNSGGLLSSAIDIASLFLDQGSLVVTTQSKTRTESYHTLTDPVAPVKAPIVVLINNYTASAAEILAGVLKVYSERASNEKKELMVFLVGGTTFGKGSVQDVIPISNGCAVKLTFSLYFLPDGCSIQGRGIEPDFAIEKAFPPTEQMLWFKRHFGRENALQNYIKHNEPDKTVKIEHAMAAEAHTKQRWIERARKVLQDDNQLRDAISIINLFHVARKIDASHASCRQKAITFIKSVLADSSLTLCDMS